MNISLAQVFGEGGGAEARAFAAAAIHTHVMEELVESPGAILAVARKRRGKSRPGPRGTLSALGEMELVSPFTRSVARQSATVMGELVGEECDDTVEGILAALVKDPEPRDMVRRIDEASCTEDLTAWADDALRSDLCRRDEGFGFGARAARYTLELGARRVYNPDAPIYRIIGFDGGSAFRLRDGGGGPVAASVGSADVKGLVSGAITGCLLGAPAGGVGCGPGAASGGAAVGFGMSVGQLAANVWDKIFD